MKTFPWPIEQMKSMYSDRQMTLQEIADLLSADEWQGYWRANLGHEYRPGQKVVNKVMKRSGTPLRKTGAPGSRNQAWNGGRHIEKPEGYVLIHCPDHPHASKKGYVREHRLVMEKHIGRYLLPSEVVHHRDDNPGNNAIENLELFESNAQHISATMTGKVPASRIAAAIATGTRKRRAWWPTDLLRKWHTVDGMSCGAIGLLLGKAPCSVSRALKATGIRVTRNSHRLSDPLPSHFEEARAFLSTAGHQPGVCVRTSQQETARC